MESSSGHSGLIIGCAMKIHRVLGPGFLESVYQNALLFELRKAGVPVESEKDLQVVYEDLVVGKFVADIVVDDAIIVETKAVQALSKSHEVQLVNYLAATSIDIGLLLNFGAASLQYRKKFRLGPRHPNTIQEIL
jgi:GxxExxY protein